ncbi:MAG: type II secretion system protein GspE [Chitinivibrionales bacterium]|nr:type II secretion system protein GspE [Chitinivibrionales bacterium]
METIKAHIFSKTNRDILSQYESISISHSVLSLTPYQVAIEYFTLPVSVDEKGRVQALMAYPHDVETLQNVQLVLGKPVRPVEATKDQVLKLINKHYGRQSDTPHESVNSTGREERYDLLSYNRTDSATTIVNDVVHEAIRLQASDIHIEPFEREMCIRFRIDGVLQEMMSVPAERIAEITSRVKVISGMDIAEKRRSQDGRIRIDEKGKDVDIRVSTLPTDFGEKIVLRLLDKSSFDYNLENLGMKPARLSIFRKALIRPNGIILLTGPTGSGKTTTLYAGINYLKKPGINISTVEDPIEYNIPGVNQTQVNLLTGMTFARSLRTLLRQDPDIIMVGEMRDQETAEIAIRSSLTGHLVLSTLHTNDAPSAVTRLIDMGIEPYLVSSSLSVIVAQRLVRKICSHCKCEADVTDNVKQDIGLTPEVILYKGLGCSACGQTGYKGRTGIYEVLPISEEIRRLINTKAYASEIRNQAFKEGLITLRENALAKLSHGITSLEEVMREIAVMT